MKFISQYPCGEGICCQEEHIEHYATGKSRVIQKAIYAEPWVQGDLTEWEKEAAFERWGPDKVKGLAEGESIFRRLSGFDTYLAQRANNWTDDERELVEQALLNNRSLGSRFIHVPEPTFDPPYALYDKHRAVQGRRTIEHCANDIRNAYEIAGFDIDKALIYENWKYAGDPIIIDTLKSLGAVAETEAEQVVTA